MNLAIYTCSLKLGVASEPTPKKGLENEADGNAPLPST
jgi:hypothetical protein